MAEPTLTDVFGAGATQDATTLTILKSDLAGLGLTAAAGNTAESLLISIVLKAAGLLTEVNRLTDTANRNIAIEFAGADIFNDGLGNDFLRRAWSISAYTDYTLPTFDPDDV